MVSLWFSVQSAWLRQKGGDGYSVVNDSESSQEHCPMSDIPVIDVSPFVAGQVDASASAAIGLACRDNGFFYIRGHGIDHALQARLDEVSRAFFEQDLKTKRRIRMELGGRAWRGYFSVGDELTSGKPDQKEGIYFAAELAEDHPKVQTGIPLHGRNLFPNLPEFKTTVLQYMRAMTDLAQVVMRGIALSLDLEANYFHSRFTDDPTILFRIFHYPPLASAANKTFWSVGEHTDYGLLTILRQDTIGGLQVKSRDTWIDAPPIADTFVCNIGDMLDRMTGGHYRSTPHRVRNRTDRGRYSFPFFFDPNWDAEIKPIRETSAASCAQIERWDGADLLQLRGSYGEYLLNKVSKVFPELRRTQL
jgi:isopenicillin N synthase-like dioxygenase